MNCIICKSGPWDESYICDECTAQMGTMVDEVESIDLDAVHAEVWEDGIACANCSHLTHGVSRRDGICMVSMTPHLCPEVQHYQRLAAGVLLSPDVMAEFVADICHETDLANVLVHCIAESGFHQRLMPLVTKWVQSLPPEKVLQHAKLISTTQPKGHSMVQQQR